MMRPRNLTRPTITKRLIRARPYFRFLRRFADGWGLLFYSEVDGTFRFGKPKAKGPALYYLYCRKSDPSRNNILSGTVATNIGESYSSVTVIGQVQGEQTVGFVQSGATEIPITQEIPTNVKATKALSVPDEFPFYKPLVHWLNKDTTSAAREASRLLEQSKAKMLSLEYTVPFHSQNRQNWQINEMCHVEDENIYVKGKYLSGDFLIYSRTFVRDKTQSITKLKLGLPGVILHD